MTKILQFPDPILLTPCEKVTIFDKDLQALVIEMLKITHKIPAAGLSANQIGISKAVFVMILSKKDYVIINPVIIKTSEQEQLGPEGCLSIGEGKVYKNVTRPMYIVVEYQDIYGKKKRKSFSGFASRVFLHEYAHIIGETPFDE